MAQILTFKKRSLRPQAKKSKKHDPSNDPTVITLQATYRPLGEKPKRGQPQTKKPKNHS
jgi:hypothetical protein